jgi:nucleoside-diphosphate-sugar epimerase
MIGPNSTVIITGGAGFLGARVAAELLQRYPGVRLRLLDIAEGSRIAALENTVEFVKADLSDRDQVVAVMDDSVDAVFHLASLVSGGAERDFEAGMNANVLATINVLEACRLHANRPVVVFTSSIATFGGHDLPQEIDDWTFQHPQNSYGVAKVVGEQLLNDYSRKGFVSGRGVRLPAIIVRDVPNTAASGYASTMVREAAAGRAYTCPVSADTRIPIMGSDTAVTLLVTLAELPDDALGDYRTVNGHGISPSAGEIAAAVEEAVGAVDHHTDGGDPARGTAGGRRQAEAKREQEGRPPVSVEFDPDPQVQQIVAAWPRLMRADRADELGLPSDGSVQSIVASYVESVDSTRRGGRE